MKLAVSVGSLLRKQTGRGRKDSRTNTKRLPEQSVARGLITFLISVATIGLAFVLIYQADGSTDDSFRRAREIFTGLMGVLGTIVGFYFGSAEKGSTPLEVAAIKSADKELVTHVSGGSPPYRYVVIVDGPQF